MARARISVLIVDDHVILRDGMRALLALYDDIELVGEAGSGQEGVDKACQLRPRVVLMDISMPGITGTEATRQIHRSNPDCRVLVLTQHEERELIYAAIDAGASGFITKTAAATELVSAIRAVDRGDSYLYPSIARVFVEDRRRHAGAGNPADACEGLTEKERDVLRLAAQGYTNKELAQKLCVSIKTVEGRKASLMSKLGIHNQTELVRYALKKGIVSP